MILFDQENEMYETSATDRQLYCRIAAQQIHLTEYTRIVVTGETMGDAELTISRLTRWEASGDSIREEEEMIGHSIQDGSGCNYTTFMFTVGVTEGSPTDALLLYICSSVLGHQVALRRVVAEAFTEEEWRDHNTTARPEPEGDVRTINGVPPDANGDIVVGQMQEEIGEAIGNTAHLDHLQAMLNIPPTLTARAGPEWGELATAFYQMGTIAQLDFTVSFEFRGSGELFLEYSKVGVEPSDSESPEPVRIQAGNYGSLTWTPIVMRGAAHLEHLDGEFSEDDIMRVSLRGIGTEPSPAEIKNASIQIAVEALNSVEEMEMVLSTAELDRSVDTDRPVWEVDAVQAVRAQQLTVGRRRAGPLVLVRGDVHWRHIATSESIVLAADPGLVFVLGLSGNVAGAGTLRMELVEDGDVEHFSTGNFRVAQADVGTVDQPTFEITESVQRQDATRRVAIFGICRPGYAVMTLFNLQLAIVPPGQGVDLVPLELTLHGVRNTNSGETVIAPGAPDGNTAVLPDGRDGEQLQRTRGRLSISTEPIRVIVRDEIKKLMEEGGLQLDDPHLKRNIRRLDL